MANDEHKITLSQLFARISSSEQGLTTAEARSRLSANGANVLKAKRKLPLPIRFLKQFVNFFALLLIAGSMLAFFAEYVRPGDGNLYIGIALAGVVVLNAIFTFIQEYQSEKIMEGFKKMLPDTVTAYRDGKRVTIHAREVVVGDVIYVEEGDRIPADARLIEQNALKVDHSSITGESEPQLRTTACTDDKVLQTRNVLFSGTLVLTGNGKAVVYGTGMKTQIGKIVSLTKDTAEVETPLRKELKHFIKIISSIAITLGISFFFVSVIIGNEMMASIIFAIGIIVANVPEGLLPTVTLSLSMASKKMAKKNALVKNLESVETLGSTNVICTDKTGTLTQNRMTVQTLILRGGRVAPDEVEKHPDFDSVMRVIVLCNNARKGEERFIGDPTETALLDFASNHIDISHLQESEKRLREYPFDSKSKRMITTNKAGKSSFDYLKGAPEVVIKTCDRMAQDKGVRRMDDADKTEALKASEELAREGMRLLGLAYKPSEDSGFIYLGCVGMWDPPRERVSESIADCKSAGIRVIMITGDSKITAEAIARKIGLVDGDANIIVGDELDSMTEATLIEKVQLDNLIFARTNPGHKLRVVKALQGIGAVVTVTGDGVNDAPALKNADMGVAMGLIGTEVAREAADMVLLDDNFASIVDAVREGRTIFENLKKFIAYILTSNVPEILPFIAFVVLGIPLPLTVVLILAIDLGTDVIPAIGLGSERPESDVMKKTPRKRTERLLTMKLLFMSYGIIGMLQAAAGFTAYFYVLLSSGWTWGMEIASNDPIYARAITAFFASIVICQVADVIICRTRRQSGFKIGLLSNEIVLIGIVVELALVAIMSYMPWANTFFGTAPLQLMDILVSVPFALVIFFGDELRKYLVRKDNRFVLKYLTW